MLARKITTLFAALILTGALLALAPSGSATSHDDVDVFDITLRDDHPTITRWTTVTAHLRNPGDTSQDVDVEFFWLPRGGTEEDLETKRYDNTTGPCVGQINNMKSVSVPAKGEAKVTLCWTPTTEQAGQTGEGRVVVSVTEALLGTGTGNEIARKSKPFKIQVPKVTLEAKWRDVDRTEDVTTPCDPHADRQAVDCEIRPDASVAFDLQLVNTGNYPDTFDLDVVGCNGGGEKNPAPWKVEPSAEELYVANDTGGSNHVRTVTLYVTAPEKAKHTDSLNDGTTSAICFRAKSLSANIPDAVQEVELPRLPVARTFAINLSNYRDNVYGLVKQPIELNASIGNDGNAPDYYKVEFVPPTGNNPWNVTADWGFDLNATNAANGHRGVRVDEYGRGDGTFYLTPPKNATRGWYNLTMRWYSPEGVNSSSFSVESRDLLHYRVRINQTYQLTTEAVMPNPIARLAPAKTASYALTVNNLGNGPDNLTYRVDNVPSGWRWTLEPLDGHQIRLAPFENRTLWFNVTTPAGEEAGKESAMFVNLTSEGPRDGERLKVSFRTKLQVLERSNFHVETSGPSRPFLDPGQTATYTITVRNVGNRIDNFTLDIDPQSTVPADWTARVEPAVLYLAPPGKQGAPQQQTARVTLTAPDTAEVGDVGGTLLTIASTENPDVTQNLDFEARVSGPDLTITDLRTRKPLVYEGEENHVLVTYANRGNLDVKNTTLTVSLVPATGSGIGLLTKEIPLVTGGASPTLEIPFNFSDLAGDATLVATIDDGNAIKEIDDTNNQRTASVFIRTWGVAIDGTAKGLTARPGERIAYLDAPNAFVLRNTGNRDEPLTVKITSEHGWLVEDSTTCPTTFTGFLLPSQGTRTFCAELRVPEYPGVNADRLTFHVTSENRPAVTLRTAVNTTILDEAPPRILGFTATPSPALVGEPVEIAATVRDAVGVDNVVATLKHAHDGSTETVSLAPVGDDRWVATTVFDRTGEVLIRLTATDASPNRNANTTKLDFVKLRVQAGSSPDVTVTLPESRLIRAGHTIPVDVTDRYDLARVWYVANGVQGGDLDEPYGIDTGTWKDGRYHVLVYAENVYGMRSVNEFNVTVDNQGPDAPDIRVSADRVKPGEPITLTIQTEAGVTEAVVVVKRDGVPVENLTARKVRDGVFEARYTPTTAGDYAFDVVVRDAVGNQRPVQGAGSFTATSNPLPAPGALAGLAMLGLAGLLRRKRRND